MKYIFELNSRTTLEESVESRHLKIIDFLKKIDPPWGIGNDVVEFPRFGQGHVAQVILNKYLGKGIKGSIFYRYRNMLSDDSSCDDRIYFEFNVKKIEYGDLVDNIFPQFIIAFEAYRAVIFDEKLIFGDFEKFRAGNLRNAVYRVYPISFFDEELCSRAFGMSSKNIAEKLENHIDVSEIANHGLFIQNSSKFFTTEEADEFDSQVRELLKK